MAFSLTSSSFVVSMNNLWLRGVMAALSIGSVLAADIIFCSYQRLFAITVVAIVIDGALPRQHCPGSYFSLLLDHQCVLSERFMDLVPNGWAYNLNVSDCAGGSPVHMSTAAAGLAYALVLGKCTTAGSKIHRKRHDLT